MIGDRGRLSDSHLTDLFAALFDDAAMFPPRDMALGDALRGHYRHRVAWYSDLVGPFVCLSGRLPFLDGLAGSLGIDRLDVSAVIPEGISAVPAVVQAARGWRHVRLRAIEVPLGSYRLTEALRMLSGRAMDGQAVFLEIEPTAITEHVAHLLAPSGIRVKLRTGETLIDAFHSEPELARALVLCAAERLAFKCSAGLHQAVRHRDSDTFFQHHGFLNIALGARIATATGNVNATQAVLAQRDPRAIAYQVADLTAADVQAIRAVFSCVSTHNVDEPLRDLIELGLVVGR
jgi:hypothetical protein